MHVYASPVCCDPPPVVRIGCQILGIWIIVMPPCVYWEPNQNLLQKQKVFLTAKPSHQPQIKNKSLKKNLKKTPCNKNHYLLYNTSQSIWESVSDWLNLCCSLHRTVSWLHCVLSCNKKTRALDDPGSTQFGAALHEDKLVSRIQFSAYNLLS